MKEVACIGVIDGDKILMGKRRDNGKWTNPGGHLNPNEDPYDGAIRELKEETGIVADSLKFLDSRTITKPNGEKLKVYAYLLKGKYKTSMKDDPDQEVHRWQYVPMNKLPEPLHVPKDNVLFDALDIEKTAKVRRFLDADLAKKVREQLAQNYASKKAENK
jgi:8-oxo-dGTP pyrophosphatase MutT (NUDIX family)